MLEFKGVNKHYKPKKGYITKALQNINIQFPNTGMVFIIGKSGSGKSTLLNLIGGLDKQDSGEIFLNNKSFRTFKNKDFDYYRNTCIGFIFQEFNLLANDNVYQNIRLGLDLKKEKISNENMENLLNEIGISGLGNRKINELSGGQKQRVAIARALAKDPNIILADEPTGNLDSDTSKQIFELLKSISEQKLVIVVSHDMESAQNYADRIIELKDGQILNDTNNNFIVEDNKELKLKKTKLSFDRTLRLAVSNLKRKKLKILVTTLLITFSLILFGFSYMLTKFDIPYTHAKTIATTNEDKIEVYKKVNNKIYAINSSINSYTTRDLNYLENKLMENKIEPLEVSTIKENDAILQINFNESYQEQENYKDYAYYSLGMYNTLFTELPESANIKIIGTKPKEKNEILVSKLFADYMIHKGIVNYDTDKEGELVSKIINFKSYDEIISKNYKINFGSTYLIISGIIDNDLSKYEYLKNTTVNEVSVNRDNLYNEFQTKYSQHWYIYVNNNFFDDLELQPNKGLNQSLYKANIMKNENKIFLDYSLLNLDKEITVYDDENSKKINKLGDNEIVINDLFLDKMTEGDFGKKQLEYLKQKEDEYKTLEEEREKKIEEQAKLKEQNPALEFEDIPDIVRTDTYTLARDFTYNYLKENSIIGSTINLQINDLYLRLSQNGTTNYENIKIVGYTSDDSFSTFVSNNIIDKWIDPNIEIAYVYFNEDNIEVLRKIFNEIPSNSKEYMVKTIYSSSMKILEKIVNKVSTIAKYTSLVFLLFSVFLFTNFVVSSINNSKKDIGILRALGTRKKDVFKIYILEDFIVGLFSLLLSLLIVLMLKDYCNTLISRDLFFTAEVLIFRIDVVYALIISIFIIVLVSSIIPIYKLSNMKPIDVIYDK